MKKLEIKKNKNIKEKILKRFKLFTYILITLILNSCIEPFNFTNIEVERNLVVKAILTDEVKHHTIELSNTVPIDATELSKEENAIVSVTDNTGNTYNFTDSGQGIYTSSTQFAIAQNTMYTLNIETQDGKSYSSTPETLPQSSQIHDLKAVIKKNKEDIPMITFKTSGNGNDPEGSFYRYEYDETYKIKTPIWKTRRINVLSSVSPFQFELVTKDPNIYGVGFCYPTKQSKNILLTETKTLSSNQISNFTIREIPEDSYFVGIRYSILLKQYTLNKNTYDFYSLLNTFSNPDDIFSQTQVGNIPSNITSNINPTKDKVIGFFEVSSITSKRFFFNREDITSESFITYVDIQETCNEGELKRPEKETSGFSPLLDLLNNNYTFYAEAPYITTPPNAQYILIPKFCGDCSHLGSPIQPSFWVD
ncbi:DUF4249 domain-containing protein [Tenacibaculum sp. S7007]|uniref:DUF4249 domain-containing protein n=1 Tax=Tenacibaculum pelagium TaxID=2759527 RepID=A0A839AJK6_9FLAO|nr:DUF4249 domain-containing protein [Tenacibaculum pelagium]MBA6155293.1 DUF4249 domain-containing protein [Tenacibaculum pelagium]